jgi:hypothetical protein
LNRLEVQNMKFAMVSRYANTFALLAGLSLLIHMDDAVPQACATLQTYNPNDPVAVQGSGGFEAGLWHWAGTGDFTLNQNSSGSIAGGIGTLNGACPDNYLTTGVMNDQGGFSLTSTDETSPSLGCTSTLYMSGKVSGAGCTVASGSWHNTSSQSGSFNMTHECFVPTGETNQVFQGFVQRTNTINGVTAVYEAAAFLMQLAPLSFNWGGRAVSETFPQPPQDGCWFPGSAVPQLVTIASKTVTVDSTGRYNDYIGPKVNDLTYYRQKGRTPCSITTQQVMTVDCPNPAQQSYSTNTQIDALGPRLLTVTRGNNPPVSEVFRPPAPALTLPAILLNLLFKPH